MIVVDGDDNVVSSLAYTFSSCIYRCLIFFLASYWNGVLELIDLLQA